MGHYTGLMHLGREAMSAKEVPVFAMPRMRSYLLENGPWSQLVSLENIDLNQLQDEEPIVLNERLSVIPFKVPHRDEFSETVGFQIVYKKKKAIFIPDIDKWDKWDEDIVAIVQNNDIALLDATFFKDGEIKGRPMSEIPHPFVEESMKLFEALTIEDKSKIYFTHFNHTNPLLIDGSDAQRRVLKQGFNLAIQEAVIDFK